MHNQDGGKVIQITLYRDGVAGWTVATVNTKHEADNQFALYTYDSYDKAIDQFKELAKGL